MDAMMITPIDESDAAGGPTPLVGAGELRLALLGPPLVYLDGRTVAFRTRKVCALLVYLTLSGRPQPREHLAAFLWPDAADGRARGLLRQTLRRLRQHLGAADDASGGAAGRLRVGRDQLGRLVVSLDRGGSPPPTLDTDLLERAANAARRPDGGDGLEPLLERASAAWRGPFLDGVNFDDAPELEAWIAARRADAQRRIGLVLDRLAECQLARGAALDAVDTAHRWLAIDPLDELGHRRLIAALAASDGPAAALAAYEQCRRVLRARLDVDPAPETAALAARLRQLGDGAARTTPRAPGRARPSASTDAPAPPLQLPFVGRGPSFEQLVASYERARAGETRVVLVEGEAGIGKTRLVDEFLGWAVLDGADVLRGACADSADRPALQPLVDALRPRLARERAPDDLVADVWLSELVRLFPELCDRYPDLPPPARLPVEDGTARTRLYEAVAQLTLALAGRARPGALVTFLDDAHWAAPAALDALGCALERHHAEGAPHLVVLAVRPEVPDAQTAVLPRRVPTVRLALDRLAPEATAPALEATPALHAFLHAQTSGHPFYLVELLREMAARGLPEGGVASLPAPVPASVAEHVRRRLAGLSGPARELALAAAVLGGSGQFDLLRRAAGLGEREGLTALDDVLRSGLLRPPLAGNRAYCFAGDLVRQAIAAEAGAARRDLFARRAQAETAPVPYTARTRRRSARPRRTRIGWLRIVHGGSASSARSTGRRARSAEPRASAIPTGPMRSRPRPARGG